MLTGVPAENIDPKTLDTMHIVLMDVVNRSIPLESLAVLRLKWHKVWCS